MAAVSPERTHSLRQEFEIAELRHAGRELTQCGLSCRSLRPLSLRCDCEGLWNGGRIADVRGIRVTSKDCWEKQTLAGSERWFASRSNVSASVHRSICWETDTNNRVFPFGAISCPFMMMRAQMPSPSCTCPGLTLRQRASTNDAYHPAVGQMLTRQGGLVVNLGST